MLKFKLLLILNAIGAGIFGFFAIFFPCQTLGLLRLESNHDTIHLMRISGVQLAALMMVMWFLIWSESKPLLRSMALAFFIYNLIAVMVSVNAVWRSELDVMNGGIILIHALLTLAYAYFTFKGRRSDLSADWD